MGRIIPYVIENKKCLKPPTSHCHSSPCASCQTIALSEIHQTSRWTKGCVSIRQTGNRRGCHCHETSTRLSTAGSDHLNHHANYHLNRWCRWRELFPEFRSSSIHDRPDSPRAERCPWWAGGFHIHQRPWACNPQACWNSPNHSDLAVSGCSPHIPGERTIEPCRSLHWNARPSAPAKCCWHSTALSSRKLMLGRYSRACPCPWVKVVIATKIFLIQKCQQNFGKVLGTAVRTTVVSSPECHPGIPPPFQLPRLIASAIAFVRETRRTFDDVSQLNCKCSDALPKAEHVKFNLVWTVNCFSQMATVLPSRDKYTRIKENI